MIFQKISDNKLSGLNLLANYSQESLKSAACFIAPVLLKVKLPHFRWHRYFIGYHNHRTKLSELLLVNSLGDIGLDTFCNWFSGQQSSGFSMDGTIRLRICYTKVGSFRPGFNVLQCLLF